MTEAVDIEKYTIDWTTFYRGGSVVCFPRSTRDVSNILMFCNENKIGVVPQGGNTGLVGGAVGLPAAPFARNGGPSGGNGANVFECDSRIRTRDRP